MFDDQTRPPRRLPVRPNLDQLKHQAKDCFAESVAAIRLPLKNSTNILHLGYGPKYDVETLFEYSDVTPLSWGARFHAQIFVSAPAMRLIAERGGHE